MDIVGEIIQDERYRKFIKECLKEIKEEGDLQEEISEVQAMHILSVKGRAPGAKQMSRYRSEGHGGNNDCLPYIPGRPITYIRGHVYDWRDRNIVTKRKPEYSA